MRVHNLFLLFSPRLILFILFLFTLFLSLYNSLYFIYRSISLYSIFPSSYLYFICISFTFISFFLSLTLSLSVSFSFSLLCKRNSNANKILLLRKQNRRFSEEEEKSLRSKRIIYTTIRFFPFFSGFFRFFPVFSGLTSLTADASPTKKIRMKKCRAFND